MLYKIHRKTKKMADLVGSVRTAFAVWQPKFSQRVPINRYSSSVASYLPPDPIYSICYYTVTYIDQQERDRQAFVRDLAGDRTRHNAKDLADAADQLANRRAHEYSETLQSEE